MSVKIEDLFTAAAGNGDVKEMASLLEQGARINDIDVSYSTKSKSIVSAQLTDGHQQKEGYAALQIAAKKGHDDCVAFLLQEGADVNQRDTKLTHEWTKSYTTYDISHQSDGFSALHEAAFFGHDNIARILLRHGATKTFVNSEGVTALDLAVRHGHGVIAHMLAEGHSAERGFY
ncbi:hypothetical protein PHMEG_0002990 [Phytophthora megakarya]|uniref:Uncharacterized protein n=1 Tax=Phytophthora megakarya TaxID=4795 RepID=A0A225WZ82_9STRA|nr:hypothetical protein PHMEG_0002990 [Phytophthora megakarya]